MGSLSFSLFLSVKRETILTKDVSPSDSLVILVGFWIEENSFFSEKRIPLSFLFFSGKISLTISAETFSFCVKDISFSDLKTWEVKISSSRFNRSFFVSVKLKTPSISLVIPFYDNIVIQGNGKVKPFSGINRGKNKTLCAREFQKPFKPCAQTYRTSLAESFEIRFSIFSRNSFPCFLIFCDGAAGTT